MSKNQLTPISFLKCQMTREKYECGICLQVCMKPARCRGSCGRIYCMKCVSDTRRHKDVCPFKCSSPFLVQAIPDIPLEFFCPYSPTDCTATITSLKLFKTHYQVCPFVSPEELLQKKLQLEYKCPNAHQLEFFIGSYEEMMNSQCAICQQELLCRSICRVCEQLYCVNCRVPPCTKDGCPLGHSYNYQQIANLNFICDMCGISTSVSNDGVYDDHLCNLGICEACYASLPDHFDPSQPLQLIANINTKCSCGNELQQKDSIHKLTPCTICTKEKQCPKHCPACLKKYCLGCKLMDVQNNETCILDHEFETIQLSKFPPEAIEQNEYGCMRCMGVFEEYKIDRECRVRLCEDCFQYCKAVTGDKKRCVMMKCDLNHVLYYLAGQQDHYYPCWQCKVNKIVKLKCGVCEVNDPNGEIEYKCYCFECRPIKLDTCYYKHPLKLAKFSGHRPCHFCNKEFDQFNYCKKCYFYVCKDCTATNHAHFQQLENQEEQLPNGKQENLQPKQISEHSSSPHILSEDL